MVDPAPMIELRLTLMGATREVLLPMKTPLSMTVACFF
jgi:hypothetical protein